MEVFKQSRWSYLASFTGLVGMLTLVFYSQLKLVYLLWIISNLILIDISNRTDLKILYTSYLVFSIFGLLRLLL